MRVHPRCLWLTLPVLLSLSACAWFGEHGQRAQKLAAPTMNHVLQAARADQALTARWPRQNWWTQFNDPTLNRLITTALAGNPDFKAAEARLRQAQTLVDAQAAELYPTIDANVSFSAQRFSANSVQAKLAGEQFRQLLINPLVLRYHLDFWGRDQAALQGAIGRSLATQAQTADAKLLLAAAVAGAYFDLQTATEQASISAQIVADRAALAALEQTRFDAGLSGEAPALQARMALNSAKQQLAALTAAAETQRYLLAALAGQGPDWGRGIAVRPGAAPPAPALPTDLPLRLLSRRPDLTAARLYAQAAAEDIKVAKTAFYPDVNLIAFAGLHSVGLTDLALQGSSLAYSVGPSLEFPIFEGGRLRANLSYREAAYDAAVERYNASLTQAVREVADSLSRWRELQDRLGQQRQNLTDAEASRQLAETLAATGLDDQSLPLQARLDANREKQTLEILVAEQRKAAVRIIKALGGGYDADSSPNP